MVWPNRSRRTYISNLGAAVLQLQALQILPQRAAEIGALQSELDCGFEETQLITRVVALSFEYVAVHFFFLQQSAHTVGELQFAADAGLGFRQGFKNRWSQDVAADHREIRRRLFRFRLLHHVADFVESAVEPAIGRLYVQHTISGNGSTFDDLRGNHRALGLVEDFDHLLQAGSFGINDVVGEEHCERLVSHQFTRHEHGVAEAQRLFLADVGDVDHVRNRAHNLEQISLLALFEHLLQFVTDVEVILNCLLAPAGNDDDLVAAGSERLFHSVLNDGLVDYGKHFFGLGFGGGQEASAQSSGGKYGFANSHGHKKIGRQPRQS